MMPDRSSDVLTGLISKCSANLFEHKQVDGAYELVRCEKLSWASKHNLQWWVKRSPEDIRVSELRPFVCISMPYLDGEELVMGSIILARNWDENLTGVYQESSKIYRCLRKRMVESL